MIQAPVRILAIVGPTASGKSELAVQLASSLNGEILSVDSRQIYRGMNIGTGKVPLTQVSQADGSSVYTYKNIPHYGIDIADPAHPLNVSEFQNYAQKVITSIHQRGKLPIMCGGTMHWMDAVVFNQILPAVPPSTGLRTKFSSYTAEQLFTELQKLDPNRAANIDRYNPRRLLRALEIVLLSGAPVPPLTAQKSPYQTIWIGIAPNSRELKEKITTRLQERIKQGLWTEIQKLHEHGLSWEQLIAFGLEYKFGSLYLQGKLTETEAREQLLTAISKYSKRQMTWWKKNPSIRWYPSAEAVLSEELNQLSMSAFQTRQD